MKDQLFKISPDRIITLELLSYFGISGFDDNHAFTRQNLKELKTVDKIIELIPRLSSYYIPCKSSKYLTDINDKKSITVLRQFLKKNNYTLMSKEKYVDGKKHLFYQVIPQQIDMLTKNRESEKVILSFD